MQFRILICQPINEESLASFLRMKGYLVDTVKSDEMFSRIEVTNYDLVITDFIDYENKFAIIDAIRKISTRVPIMIIAQTDYENPDTAECEKALEHGADFYCTLPYSLSLIAAHANALLRRIGISRTLETYTIGQYTLDTQTRVLTYKPNNCEASEGVKISMTPLEFETLCILAAHPNELVTKEFILERAWKDANYYNSRSLDVCMVRIRKSLRFDKSIKIETIFKKGYILKF